MEKMEIQPLIRRTAVIGIGTSGLLSVLYAKKTLEQYYGRIPLAVRFLVLDTTQNWERGVRFMDEEGVRWKDMGIEPHEFCYLSVTDPTGVIRTSPSIQRWWPEGYPTKTVLHGAGQMRALGRLALHANAPAVTKKLGDLLTPLTDMGLGSRMQREQGLRLNPGLAEINLYLVGSLAGGTGSGCLIDLGFVLRELCRTQLSKIYGYFILPWIFQGLAATRLVNSNAYAALRELDHTLSLDYARERPQFSFGLQEVSADRPPYDVVNLIDGRNEIGTNIGGKGTSQGVENLCERIGLSIALNAGSVGQGRDDVLVNLASLIAAQDKQRWDSKYPHYSSFGLSTLVYPMEKHFNRAYSLYSFLLIDDAQRVSRGEAPGSSPGQALEIDPQEIERDVRDFSTEVRLWDEDNHVLDDLIGPGSIDASIPMPEERVSPDELAALADAEESRVEDAVRAVLERNLPGKQRTASEGLREALKERERRRGPAYSLRFAERLGGQMEAFREKRLAEVQQMEGELAGMRSQADQRLEELKESGLWERIRGRRKELGLAYLDQRSLLLKTRMEIERRRASWEVFDALQAETARYKEGMNLSGVEKKLSRVREQIYQQLFTSTVLTRQYVEYAVMVEPFRIVMRVKGKEGVKAQVTASRKSWENFSDFLKEMEVRVDFNEFLREQELDYGKLTEIPLEALKEKLLAYSQRQMAFVKEMTLEDVILFGLDEDQGQEEKLKEQLREASSWATPLWYHKAVAERAAMMQELFILGVGNEEKSRLKTGDYGVRLLPYLSTQHTHHPPNFTSTLDPYKLFFFKYKAPLPAFLLQDMDAYRKEYHRTPVSMTPHSEKDMELKSEDLFPHTAVEERQLRAFALAVSPPFGLIRERMEERGRERLQAYYLMDQRLVTGGEERLGESRLSAFEAFGEEQRRALRKRVIAALKEDYPKDPGRVRQELQGHLKGLEERFAGERKRLQESPKDSPLTLGEELLLRDEIGAIGSFLRFGGSLEDFLERIG